MPVQVDDGVARHRLRHPLLQHALAAAAQQLAVTAFHGDGGVLHEADRLAAEGRCPPLTSGEGAGPVQGLGDLAIAGAGKMPIETSDHQNEALAQACRDRPRAWHGACRAAPKATPQTQQSGETERDIVVQRNERGHPCARAQSPQPHAVRAFLVLQHDMTAVRPLDGNDLGRSIEAIQATCVRVSK